MSRTVTVIDSGEKLNYTSASGHAVGAVISFTNFVGIAESTVASGGVGAVALRGKFSFPVATAGSIAVGTALYWDASGSVVTTTSTSMVACGRLAVAKATGDATCTVLIPMTAIA